MGTGSAFHLQKLLNMIKNNEKTPDTANMLGLSNKEINGVSFQICM